MPPAIIFDNVEPAGRSIGARELGRGTWKREGRSSSNAFAEAGSLADFYGKIDARGALGVRVAEPSELVRFDPDGRLVFNVNTPDGQLTGDRVKA